MNDVSAPERSFASEELSMGPAKELESAESVRRAQYMKALELANETRSRRSDIKFALGERIIAVEEVLEDESLASMPVFDLIKLATRKPVGRSKTGTRNKKAAQRVMDEAKIPEIRTVGKLTEHQRQRLSVALTQEGYGPSSELVPPKTFDDEEYIQRFGQALEIAREIRQDNLWRELAEPAHE